MLLVHILFKSGYAMSMPMRRFDIIKNHLDELIGFEIEEEPNPTDTRVLYINPQEVISITTHVQIPEPSSDTKN